MKPKAIYKSTDQIPPGKYLRRWSSYSVVVDVYESGGVLLERTPTGRIGEVRENVGATYESVEVAA